MRHYVEPIERAVHDAVRRFALWLLAWVDACPICGAPWAEHRCPYTPAVTSDQTCGVCDVPLPIDAVRSHDGHWRCATHKGIR